MPKGNMKRLFALIGSGNPNGEKLDRQPNFNGRTLRRVAKKVAKKAKK